MIATHPFYYPLGRVARLLGSVGYVAVFPKNGMTSEGLLPLLCGPPQVQPLAGCFLRDAKFSKRRFFEGKGRSDRSDRSLFGGLLDLRWCIIRWLLGG